MTKILEHDINFGEKVSKYGSRTDKEIW